jgi:hypothetical protein
MTDYWIKRLLDPPPPVKAQPSRVRILSISISMILALALVQGFNTVLLFAAMGCNLLDLLANLL